MFLEDALMAAKKSCSSLSSGNASLTLGGNKESQHEERKGRGRTEVGVDIRAEHPKPILNAWKTTTLGGTPLWVGLS